jgi:hypothetical protein
MIAPQGTEASARYDEFDTSNPGAPTDPWLDGAATPPNLVLNPE